MPATIEPPRLTAARKQIANDTSATFCGILATLSAALPARADQLTVKETVLGACKVPAKLGFQLEGVHKPTVCHEQIRVISIGAGEYPAPTRSMLSIIRWVEYLFTVRLLQKTMEINTQSMEQLLEVLFGAVATVRVNERYTEPEMATDMFEHDMSKLNLLWLRGRQSFEKHEDQLKAFLL
jgi:hypothetical protein